MKLFKSKEYTAGDRQEICEERIEEIKFTIHKFTNKPKSNVTIFPCFSEFGSEIVASVYCIPKLMRTKYKDNYTIVMGWKGRAYLYKHLVDEFWEINEEHMWLRDWCRAFHHDSKNLRQAEKQAKQYGNVVNVNEFGYITSYPKITECFCKSAVLPWNGYQVCTKCGKAWLDVGIFNDITKAKNQAVWTPQPSQDKLDYVSKYLKPNSVGISARARKCYGRNLPSIFYERLIYLLEDLGYNPIWIGEKITTLPCPIPRITDFSRTEDANDLEKTLALVSQLKFTVQFWTASTRLAGLMGTPFLLIESPDQIWGNGQEGMRLSICTKGNKKIVACHYRSFLDNQNEGLKIVEKAIKQMANNDYSDVIGMVENQRIVEEMRRAKGLDG